MRHWSSKSLKLMCILVVSVVVVNVVGWACGGGDSGGKTPAASTLAGGGPASLELSMGDNFFDQNGTHNPTLEVTAGAPIEIKLTNHGSAVHNMRIAGEDDQYNTSDDAVSDPNLVNAGQSAVLKFTAPKKAGTYRYQCDFHPAESKGEITVK